MQTIAHHLRDVLQANENKACLVGIVRALFPCEVLKHAMKTTLCLLFLFCAAAAVSQTVSNQAQVLELPDHPQHASAHPLATEQPLVGGGSADTYTYAQGERPLWEFSGMVPPPMPLGDVARAFRKEKLAVKKAEKVLEKQGS